MLTASAPSTNQKLSFHPSLIVVGISDYKVYNKIDTDIVTYALGSCVGLSLYEPYAKVGGILHCKLPDSSAFGQKYEETPAAFVDTGVPELLSAMFKMGAIKRRMVAKIAGGASVLKDSTNFNIGERNCESMIKTLKHWAIPIKGEATGKKIPRTMYLDMKTGKTCVKTGNDIIYL